MKNRIREGRAKMALTQEQLADRVGVSRQTIISLENGRYNPSLLLAHKIAHVFACTIEDVFLFEGAEER